MNRNRFLRKAAIAAVVLIMSCNRDKEASDGTIVELRLVSGVEVSTRAAFPDSDTKIPNGEEVNVYVDEAGGAVQLYPKTILIANGANALSGPRMNFPANGNNVDIYALHTNATVSTAFPTDLLTHTVRADQRSLADYASSDLLYAKKTNVARTASPVLLTFNHLLSKLQVAIMAGEGLTDRDITGIIIGGTRPQAQFTLTKEIASNAVAITPAGAASSITIGADVSVNLTSNITFNDAIIVPQTLRSGTEFITVQLSGGTNLVYRLPEDTNFEKGKKYGYLITAKSNSLELVLITEIEDWVSGGNTPIDITME